MQQRIDRNKWNIPFGNSCHPATKAHNAEKERLAAGIYKTEYRLNMPNVSTFYDITKTEYDYFKNMELAEDKATEANEIRYKIEAGTATEEEDQEYIDKDLEFFHKYCR